jgi:predicted metalloprotease with PDZ domain
MILSALLCAALAAQAASSPPRLEYRLKFDPADTTRVGVSLEIHKAPASMVIAANAHPEYDDKYWRYVEHLNAVTVCGEMIPVSRIDSVRWQVHNKGTGDIVVAYQVKFPESEMPRPSWKPFLSPTGGLVGGPHSFLYAVGLENESATVTLDIPSTWKTGTGLSSSSRDRTFTAADVHTLMESPMLVGELSEWQIDQRHTVFYWKLPNAKPFDSVAFVAGIGKIASQANTLFGGAPYKHYRFLFQDGAWSGGLEHPNSVTLGAPSEELAKDPHATLAETAHEFFHTWNLMAIKPAAYREVDYKAQPPVAELWFSEGLTIFYADLLLRRAGLPTSDSTRTAHLERLIARYLGSPGLALYSAEQISRVEYNASPGALGDYLVSSHLQGEVIGILLDLLIRDATDGARSMDHVMKLLYERTRAKRLTSREVQTAVEDVCKCRGLEIFERHVFAGNPVDFNRYLKPLGLRAEVSWTPSMNDDGTPAPDLRASAWLPEGEQRLRLRVMNPGSVWGRAGLHTGDVIVTIDGNTVRTWPEFRTFIRGFAIGDSATIVVQRGDSTITRRIVMAGFDRPIVHLRSTGNSTPREERLRSAWLRGSPGT